MSILDELELGGALLNARNTSKAMRQIRKANPEYYAAINVLGKVCLESDLNFSAHATKDGNILFGSDTLVKGPLSQPKMSCYAFTSPDNWTTSIIYVPEDSGFVKSNKDAYYLLNWVNSQVDVGAFFVQREYRNNVGKEIIKLAYKVGVDHSKCPAEKLAPVFKSLLESILSFREAFDPIVQKVSSLEVQDLRSNELDELAGEMGIDRVIGINPLSDEQIHQASDAKLKTVLDCLASLNIPWRSSGNEATNRREGRQSDSTDALRVSLTQSKVVLESPAFSVPAEQQDEFMLLESLRDWNYQFDTGNVHLNTDANQATYRTGLDYRSTPSDLIAQMLENAASAQHRVRVHLLAAYELGVDLSVLEGTGPPDERAPSCSEAAQEVKPLDPTEGLGEVQILAGDTPSDDPGSKSSRSSLRLMLILGAALTAVSCACCGAYTLIGPLILGGR